MENARIPTAAPDLQPELDSLLTALAAGSPPSTCKPCEHLIRRMAGLVADLAAKSNGAELKYRTLFDHASEAIAVLSPDGTILEVNQRWEEILRLGRQHMVGRHIREFAAPGHEDGNVEQIRNIVDSGQAQTRLFPIQRRDGSTVYMDISNTPVDVAGERFVFSIGRDVTETIEAKARLQASEQKYQLLIENIPDIVWSSTVAGQITFMSPHVESICGFSADELREADPTFWFDRIHADDVERVRAAFDALSADEQVYDSEYRWRRRDGEWIWLRARAVRIKSADGEAVEGTFSEITPQKRLEEQVRQSQKMEAIGQLTGGIAHDFNNILAVILGNGRMLLDELPQGDVRRDDADAIIDAGERAASLTRQLLTFSRKQIVQPTVLSVNTVAQGVEKMLRRVIGEDVELGLVLTDGLGSVLADAGEIEQVMMNLVVNARDAMPAGGKILIDTANVDIDEEYTRTHADAVPGPYVVLTVTDTGSGMDAETKRRIFEPFFTTKENGRGTGLGLSTCYGIVRRSRGHIWVYSELGQGTVFKVYLPRVDSAPQPAAIRSGDPERFAGTETILVVEDDDQLRKTVARILTRRGYRVLASSGGREAMVIADSHDGPIDLILSDMIMPGLNGPEAVEAIQQSAPQARALFMSGYTDHPMLRDGVVKTGVNFIQKPFAPQALAQKVRAVLDA